MTYHTSWNLAQVLDIDHRELRLFIDELQGKIAPDQFEQNFNRLQFNNVLTYYAMTDAGLEILLNAVSEMPNDTQQK